MGPKGRRDARARPARSHSATLPAWPLGGHRLERVGDKDDPRLERNLVTAESERKPRRGGARCRVTRTGDASRTLRATKRGAVARAPRCHSVEAGLAYGQAGVAIFVDVMTWSG